MFCFNFTVDPIVALFTSVLRVVEIQNGFLKNNLATSFSPEVASTLLWLLKRWVRCYSTTNSVQLKSAPILCACFDLKNDSGKFILKILLETAELNLYCWSGEPQVSEDVSSLLLHIFGGDKGCKNK